MSRTVANRTGRQYMKKRLILRGFLPIGERARRRKNWAGKVVVPGAESNFFIEITSFF
jgi:hypothetical protein